MANGIMRGAAHYADAIPLERGVLAEVGDRAHRSLLPLFWQRMYAEGRKASNVRSLASLLLDVIRRPLTCRSVSSVTTHVEVMSNAAACYYCELPYNGEQRAVIKGKLENGSVATEYYVVLRSTAYAHSELAPVQWVSGTGWCWTRLP